MITRQASDSPTLCEVSEGAEAAWVRTILERAIDRTAFLAACTPGRLNNEGEVHLRPCEERVEGGGVRGVHARSRDRPGKGTVERAGVDELVAQPPRHLTGHRGFARARRAVDGHHRLAPAAHGCPDFERWLS